MFKFENLLVWQKSIELSTVIHKTIKNFPNEEKYVLSSQLQRASDSISLNIAEGSTGQSKGEYRRFLGYALRSAIEVVSCLHLAKNRNLISNTEFDENYLKTEEIIKMIFGLRNSLKD